MPVDRECEGPSGLCGGGAARGDRSGNVHASREERTGIGLFGVVRVERRAKVVIWI